MSDDDDRKPLPYATPSVGKNARDASSHFALRIGLAIPVAIMGLLLALQGWGELHYSDYIWRNSIGYAAIRQILIGVAVMGVGGLLLFRAVRIRRTSR